MLFVASVLVQSKESEFDLGMSWIAVNLIVCRTESLRDQVDVLQHGVEKLAVVVKSFVGHCCFD